MSLNLDTLYSQETECATIGSVLINPGAMAFVGHLQPEDFGLLRHQAIWRALLALDRQKQPLDILAVTEYMTQKGTLSEAGGPAYLTQLISTTPSSLNADIYAASVRSYARRRQVKAAAEKLVRVTMETSDENLESQVAQVAGGLLEKSVFLNSLHHWGAEIGRQIDSVAAMREHPRDVWGIATGFEEIDAYSGGLHLGETLWIAGAPAAGKSILAAQLALMSVLPSKIDHVKAKAVGIYTLENSEALVTLRTLTGWARIKTLDALTGNMSDDDYSLFLEFAGAAANLPVYIRDKSISLAEWRADLRRAKKLYGIEVVVLDYLYLMQAAHVGPKDDRTEIISREAVQIIKDEGLAGIFVNSVTKEAFEGSNATNENMRGSGQQIHDADTVAFLLHAKADNDPLNPNYRKLKFTKGRNLPGTTTSVMLEKADQYPWFGPVKITNVTMHI